MRNLYPSLRATCATICCLLVAFPGPALAGVHEECRQLASSPAEPGNTGVGILDSQNIVFDRAFAPCQKAAGAPDATPPDFYRFGRVLFSKKQYSDSIKWFRKAAEKSYPPALFNLGLQYLNGLGVTSNKTFALYLIESSANQNFVYAQSFLGTNYLIGREIKQDYKLAATFLQKAADLGDVNSLYNLGYMYYNGLFFEKNIGTSIILWRKAAALGSNEAKAALTAMPSPSTPNSTANGSSLSSGEIAVGLGALLLLGLALSGGSSDEPPNKGQNCHTEYYAGRQADDGGNASCWSSEVKEAGWCYYTKEVCE